MKTAMPFTFDGAVILSDHMHFLWTLPTGEKDFSKRVGKMNLQITKGIDVGRSLLNKQRVPRPQRPLEAGVQRAGDQLSISKE